ncbi:hypothetical protein WJX72_008408 [[Myrmecia] bisecta]|uniref:Rhodanese domain-containing protein n=1 Tax=[Myrmecia] bisecta TaxID=41462 RepID=A0AAW1P4R7_9CHLO
MTYAVAFASLQLRRPVHWVLTGSQLTPGARKLHSSLTDDSSVAGLQQQGYPAPPAAYQLLLDDGTPLDLAEQLPKDLRVTITLSPVSPRIISVPTSKLPLPLPREFGAILEWLDEACEVPKGSTTLQLGPADRQASWVYEGRSALSFEAIGHVAERLAHLESPRLGLSRKDAPVLVYCGGSGGGVCYIMLTAMDWMAGALVDLYIDWNGGDGFTARDLALDGDTMLGLRLAAHGLYGRSARTLRQRLPAEYEGLFTTEEVFRMNTTAKQHKPSANGDTFARQPVVCRFAAQLTSKLATWSRNGMAYKVLGDAKSVANLLGLLMTEQPIDSDQELLPGAQPMSEGAAELLKAQVHVPAAVAWSCVKSPILKSDSQKNLSWACSNELKVDSPEMGSLNSWSVGLLQAGWVLLADPSDGKTRCPRA